LDTSPNSRIEIFGRSGKHVNGRPCEGIKYNMVISSDGYFRGNIKHFHSGGLQELHGNSVLGDVNGRKIGIKFIVYNNNSNINNVTAVRIEALVDVLDDNNWQRVFDFTDTGEKSIYLKCGDENTKIISWGGPIIGINIFNFPLGGLALEKMSVREIDALSPKVTIPTPPAPVDPEAVSAPVAPPSTSIRADGDDLYDDDIYELPSWGDPGDNPPP
jgi:hypothetical protein